MVETANVLCYLLSQISYYHSDFLNFRRQQRQVNISFVDFITRSCVSNVFRRCTCLKCDYNNGAFESLISSWSDSRGKYGRRISSSRDYNVVMRFVKQVIATTRILIS